MTVTVTNLRTNFPEFKDPLVYADPEVQFWLGLALTLLDAGRWGASIDYGQQLFVAHNLALGFTSRGQAASGQQPGQVVGALSSASVDKVSYSRDSGSAMDPSNGHWNLTTFGLRFIQLSRMMGAGPVYVGAPSANDWVPGAWPGPGVWP